VGREILAAGLENRVFIERATSGFDAYRESVEPWTLERGSEITGIAPDEIRRLAHAYARAGRAQICWTLGITEHHNAADNVFALINLGLLTGHVGRYGSGLCPLRGQNNVQGGGDMGAIPNKLPGFQDLEDAAMRAPFERAWGVKIPPTTGWHLSQMFEAMKEGKLRTLFIVGENPAQSEADATRARRLLEGLDHIVVQDISMTATAEMADVVLPAAAGWAETEGTVTSSERRVQRVRKALEPPGEARDDLWILAGIARRLGHEWGEPTAEAVWDELRSLSPMHGGMSYARLDEMGGIQWPCPDESHPGTLFLHGRLWEEPRGGPPASFIPVDYEPPVDQLTDEYPIRLTTGRCLDSFNTGVQSGAYTAPIRRGGSVELSPEDAEALAVVEGDRVRVTSRRGSVAGPVRIDPGLRPGLAFMTLHFPDEIDTNLLTIDAWDPKSGTAEFKASAVRIEKLEPALAG
jgi:formate dehydrogenase major subunit